MVTYDTASRLKAVFAYDAAAELMKAVEVALGAEPARNANYEHMMM